MVVLNARSTLQAVLGLQANPLGFCNGHCALAKLVKHGGQAGVFKCLICTGGGFQQAGNILLGPVVACPNGFHHFADGLRQFFIQQKFGIASHQGERGF
ncbi:hypothetical protein D3C76_1252060 [compost metagenome]